MRPLLNLFVLYHNQGKLDSIPNLDCAQKVNVATINVPYRSNMIGEGRAFLADLDTKSAQYVGVVNARWDHKYDQFDHKLQTKLADLPAYVERCVTDGTMNPRTVHAPWTTDSPMLDIKNEWYEFTLKIHPTMEKLLRELQRFTGMEMSNKRRTFWANDFICHRLAYFDFIEFWRRCFRHFHSKYGYLLPMSTYGVDTCRYAAYFYERVSALYWANRTDLEVVPIP